MFHVLKKALFFFFFLKTGAGWGTVWGTFQLDGLQSGRSFPPYPPLSTAEMP